jgi:hypothetical protein
MSCTTTRRRKDPNRCIEATPRACWPRPAMLTGWGTTVALLMHMLTAQSATVGQPLAVNRCEVVQGGRGFWLQHSVPKFPQPPAGPSAMRNYSGVAPAQRVFGQHFLCLSLDVAGVETVAATLRTAFPLVFSRRLPRALTRALPQVQPFQAGALLTMTVTDAEPTSG